MIEKLSQQMPINRVITTTTRPPRPGEKQGQPYYFISKDEFQRGIRQNKFVEWAREYNNNYYGVSREELERVNNLPGVGIWKMEYKGVMTAKKKFPEIIAILLLAESLEELERRIRERGETDEKYIRERMNYTKEWLRHKDIYDFQVVNRRGKLAETVQRVAQIIKEHLAGQKNNDKQVD